MSFHCFGLLSVFGFQGTSLWLKHIRPLIFKELPPLSKPLGLSEPYLLNEYYFAKGKLLLKPMGLSGPYLLNECYSVKRQAIT